MAAKAIMFMGTGSDVGKSLIVAGLCRALKNRKIKVAPFKPQNMSNNAAVCKDGGEIGRAQALQAKAAKIEPSINMNPILLKPEHEKSAQLIVRGKRVGSMSAKQYFSIRQKYKQDILSAYNQLKQQYDFIIVEGAGSASEVNLRQNDLANFGFAQAANIPVILIGDIERGGVIASIIGTFNIIDKKDRKLLVGTLINKFSGDKSLFVDGQKIIEQQTKLPLFGIVPYFTNAQKLPAEDILALKKNEKTQNGAIHISILRLSRIANFDEFDPLIAQPEVKLEFIKAGNPIPQSTDLIIIPGSKATIADMKFIIEQGWDIDIRAHIRAGKKILGICGGFQILGEEISDPFAIEGKAQTIKALGLLKIKTILSKNKRLEYERAIDVIGNNQISGYHMHMGKSEGEDCARPFAKIGTKGEGAISKNGQIIGTYLHGIFANDDFRHSFLKYIRQDISVSKYNYDEQIETVLDELANHLEEHLNIDEIIRAGK